jgi:hypothetical protein
MNKFTVEVDENGKFYARRFNDDWVDVSNATDDEGVAIWWARNANQGKMLKEVGWRRYPNV